MIQVLTTDEQISLLKELDPRSNDRDEFGLALADGSPTPTDWKRYRNVTAALLMLDAGLRVGEVVRLRRHDLYALNRPVNTLIVRKEIAKGRHERSVPLTPRLGAALLRLQGQPLLIPDWPITQPTISNTPQGHAVTTRTIERIITAAAMQALGRPVHPHVLRHTYGTRLMKVTDIRTVQELLGHKHVSSTQIYTHVTQDDLVKAIEAISTPTTPTTAPSRL